MIFINWVSTVLPYVFAVLSLLGIAMGAHDTFTFALGVISFLGWVSYIDLRSKRNKGLD